MSPVDPAPERSAPTQRHTPGPISGGIPSGGAEACSQGIGPHLKVGVQWPALRIIWRQTTASKKNKSITGWCLWWINAVNIYVSPRKVHRTRLNWIDIRWPLPPLHPSKWVFKPRCRRLLTGSLAVKHFYNQTLLFAASLWEMRPCSFFKRANQP